MNLLERIEKEMRDAIKGSNTLVAETLKMLKSDMMYEKAKTGKDLAEDKMLEVVTRAAKRRKEAIEEYRKGNREDLAKKEEDELRIIEAYLPALMTAQEVQAFIDAKLATMGTIAKKDFGKIMGELMKELKGKADGAVVKGILNGKMEQL